MAKKSSKKSSNKKLFDLILFVLAGGIFGLLAMTFISGSFTSLLGSVTKNISGYNLLDFEANSGFATIILLFIIFASLLILSSLLKLCCDANIVKNKTLEKVAKFAVVVISFAILVLSIVAMIVIPTNCSSYSLGGIVGAGTHANWFTLILFAVVSFGSFCVSIVSIKK